METTRREGLVSSRSNYHRNLQLDMAKVHSVRVMCLADQSSLGILRRQRSTRMKARRIHLSHIRSIPHLKVGKYPRDRSPIVGTQDQAREEMTSSHQVKCQGAQDAILLPQARRFPRGIVKSSSRTWSNCRQQNTNA